MTVVAYDPFAREGLVRRCEGAGACDWCGSARKRVYSYTGERGGGFPPGRVRTFCNLDCWKVYGGR